MCVEIAPKLIKGEWSEGYALDFQTVATQFLGYNSYGQPEYQTTRTPLGELMFRLKYEQDYSGLEFIAETVAEFLSSWEIEVDLLIAVPPTGTKRKRHPVEEISKFLREFHPMPVSEKAVSKVKSIGHLRCVLDYQERVSALNGAFAANPEETRGKRILLFDDLYRSGATLNAVASALKKQGEAASVYALTVTRTRGR
jgi:competence protein ComFC